MLSYQTFGISFLAGYLCEPRTAGIVRPVVVGNTCGKVAWQLYTARVARDVLRGGGVVFDFEPVRSTKAYVQVVNQIRQLIADGKLKPGDRLPPERVLAEQFGVSRPSIREALAVLEMSGLTEGRTGYGSVVKGVPTQGTGSGNLCDDSSPYEIMEGRLALEPQMAQLAALRRDDDDVKRFIECYKTMCCAMAENDHDAYNQADADFHHLIARAAHNDLLAKVGAGVRLGMEEKLWQALKTKALRREGVMARYTREHKEILDSIIAQDAETAAELAREHILKINEDIF